MKNPTDPPSERAAGRNALGALWIKQGRFEKAIAIYDRLIDEMRDQTAPEWYLPYLHRGIAARQIGFDDQALADFRAPRN